MPVTNRAAASLPLWSVPSSPYLPPSSLTTTEPSKEGPSVSDSTYSPRSGKRWAEASLKGGRPSERLKAMSRPSAANPSRTGARRSGGEPGRTSSTNRPVSPAGPSTRSESPDGGE